MKIVIGLVCLIVLLGAVYGLGRAHLLPLKGISKSSPAVGKLLVALKFVAPTPPPAKSKPVAAQPHAQPQVDPLAAQKRELSSEEAEVYLEKKQLDAKLAAPAPAVAPTAPILQTSPQLIAIYEAMDSDDLATLFAKEPDSTVVSALIGMDTKKAAKALAAIPADRAAKITALMNQAMATAPTTPPS